MVFNALGRMKEKENTIYNNGRQIIFGVLFAIYVVEHHFYKLRDFYSDISSYILLSLALIFLIFPRNYPLFLIIVIGHLVQTVMHLPTGSNHNLLSFFVTLGIAATYVQVALSEKKLLVSPAKHFEVFVPLGRWVLLIMYFYGTFHKINTDFLDPASSCAVTFWRRYGFPDFIDQTPFVHSLTIYGTLVLEAAIIAMLLSRRFRWWGVLLGICFHAFLAYQPDGWFRAFSILSIALHSLFLPADALSRFANGKLGRVMLGFFAPPGRRILYGMIVLIAWVAAWIYLPRPIEWSLVIGLIVMFVIAYCRESPRQAAPIGSWLRSPSVVINVLVIAFFLNGLSPYVGFKTGQSISMFSNLTTEGEHSNHLFMPNISLFDYQSRIATIVETDHPTFNRVKNSGLQLVEYQLLDYLERSQDFTVSFEVNGQPFTHSPQQPLAALSDMSPRWLRNLFTFRAVNIEPPHRCHDL